MRLLVINPNISESVTRLIEAEARRAADAATEIVAVTAPFGVAYIETRSEAVVGAYAVLNLLAERGTDCDAAIVAAFGDPGVPAAREIAAVPVVGISEAAFVTASLLGRRFSIVAISRRIAAWYRECAEFNKVDGRLASIRTLTAPLRDVGTVQEDNEALLLELCSRAVEEDGAEVIVLAGAPLAGLGRRIADRVPVPLVDGVSSAVLQAEALVRLDPRAPEAGSFAPPPDKPQKGLSAALAALIGRQPAD